MVKGGEGSIRDLVIQSLVGLPVIAINSLSPDRRLKVPKVCPWSADARNVPQMLSLRCAPAYCTPNLQQMCPLPSGETLGFAATLLANLPLPQRSTQIAENSFLVIEFWQNLRKISIFSANANFRENFS